MQYKTEQYDKEKHRKGKALTVKNPYAEWIADGRKQIEVRSRPTKYRGELIICSSQSPQIEGMLSGCSLAAVELYDVKPLNELTAEEWEQTKIPIEQRASLVGFGWFLKNPIRLIEYPVKGQLGIWTLVVDYWELIPYKNIILEEVTEKKSLVYNKKAVKDGLIVISIIFVLVLAILTGIFKAAFYLYNLFQ
jgi:hypothetical protein